MSAASSVSKKKQQNVSQTSGSASRISGSMMNTGSNYNSESAKTAESGGSVGFNNGSNQRLGQSQSSNSASYQTAASSASKKRPRNEVNQPRSKRLRQSAKRGRDEKARQIQELRVKSMNAQRRANEIKRAMNQIQGKIEARKKEKARVKALTNQAARQRAEAANQAKKNAAAKRAKIIEYIQSANLFPLQKSFFLKEINTTPQSNFNNLKSMVNRSIEDKRRLNRVTGGGATNKAAENAKRAATNKAAENAKRAATNKAVVKSVVGTKRPRTNSPNAPSSKKPRNVRAELERMKLSELKISAKEKGIKGISKIKKNELIELLLAHKNKPNSPKNQETLKNRKVCEALFKVYISKITESKRAGIEKRAGEIIAQMMKYNIAFDQSAKSMNKMSNVSQTINMNDYFNVLLIMWLDGIHDKYVNTYFVDWYKTQIKSKILPSHHEQDIVKMATSIKENHKNVLIGVLQYLKEMPEYENIYNIIIAGIQSSGELTTKGEVGSYSDVMLVQMCDIVKCPPDKTKRLTKIFHLKKVLFDTKGNVIKNVPRPDTIQFPAGWEKSVKNFLVKYFKTSVHKSNTITLPGNEGLLLSIDQEYSSNQERPLTELIDNNTTTGLVTFGQALDPGSTMLPRLITQDLITMINPKPKPMTNENGNSRIHTVNTSNVIEKKFIPNVKYYLNNFKFELKDSNGRSLFNLDLDPFSGGIPTLKFNGNVMTVNQSAGKAGKAGKEADKISKYFGDALQYLIFTNLSSKKFETVNKTRYPFLGSGDSMAMLGYTIFSKIVGTKPRMLIDFSESSDPIYHPVNLQPGAVFGNRRRVEATEGGRIIQ